MRNSASEIVAALQAAPNKGLVPFRLVTLWPRDRDSGDEVAFSFWSEPVPAAIATPNRDTGALESRDYVGGAVIAIDPVKLVVGLQLNRTWSVSLNALNPAVRDMLANHDMRRALVEYHRVPADIVSRRPVADPVRRFLGRVSKAPEEITIGDDTYVQISCIVATNELTYPNPTRRSHVAQQRRSADAQMQYVDVAAAWPVNWGQAAGGIMT